MCTRTWPSAPRTALPSASLRFSPATSIVRPSARATTSSRSLATKSTTFSRAASSAVMETLLRTALAAHSTLRPRLCAIASLNEAVKLTIFRPIVPLMSSPPPPGSPASPPGPAPPPGRARSAPRRCSRTPARKAERLHDLLDVLPHQALVARVAQQVGGMEGRHELDAVVVVPAPAELRDRRLRPEQRLDRELAERHDHLGGDQLELTEEEGLAARHLVRLGVAVLRRPALDDVRDVDVVALEPHALGDDLGQELAGAPDEGLALQVLVAARRLAHEHEARARVADAEHEVRAVRGELAPLAVAEVSAQLLERARRPEPRRGEEVPGGRGHGRGTLGVDGRRRRSGRRRRGARGAREAEHAELALVLHVGAQCSRQLRAFGLRRCVAHYTIRSCCSSDWLRPSCSPGRTTRSPGVP